jgi:hypothetical protein
MNRAHASSIGCHGGAIDTEHTQCKPLGRGGLQPVLGCLHGEEFEKAWVRGTAAHIPRGIAARTGNVNIKLHSFASPSARSTSSAATHRHYGHRVHGHSESRDQPKLHRDMRRTAAAARSIEATDPGSSWHLQP